MGWWMVLWGAGIIVLALLVRLVTGSVGGFSPRGDETPERILKRRNAKGEIVVVDEAVRDEGTSLHDMPPSGTVAAPAPGLVELLG